MNSLPKSFTTGITHWQVTTNHADHFRADGRSSLRHASADEKGLLGCGLLFALGGTALALGAALAGLDAVARLLRSGPHPAALREALIYLTLALGWFGLLYALFPKVWVLEARPGHLRFGWRTWEAGQVQALEVEERHGKTDTVWDADYPFSQRNTFAVTVFWLRLADGRRLRVWQVGGRARKAAEAWARRMAEVAGVPVAEQV